MNFELDEEQRQLQDSCRRLLQDTCAFERRASLVAQGSFEPGRWRTYAGMGWLMMAVPESRGGLGRGAVETCLLMEELGRSLCVEPLWAIGVQAAQLLVALDAGPVVTPLLDGLMAGSARPVLAHGEPHARGDLDGVTTRAHPDGSGAWTLQGEKSLVVGGNVADAFLVSARVMASGAAPDAALSGSDPIGLFLVPRDAPGLRRQDVRLIDNRWAAHLTLEGVAVTAGQRLDAGDRPGQALSALGQAQAHATLALCAEALGLMDRALWATRDYLKLRHQFGVPLASFQALQHRMSDMLIELELARSMVYRGLSRLDDAPAERDAAVSAAKVLVGRSGRYVCGQAIQLHGGIGVTEACVIGHYFKRMTMIESALGHGQIHLARLAERERLGLA